MTIDVKEKDYDAKLEQKTVVDTPELEERRSPAANLFLVQVAEASQAISPWGKNPKLRDEQLRSFWPSEPWLSSVVYSVSIRNASFAWEVIGSNPEKPQPRNTIKAVERVLKNSNRGKGWIDLILKTCIDLYTVDNGAFWEIIRTKNRPDAPVINISHLDSLRCQRTGDPEWPVIYTDRYGKEIALPYWRVKTLEEFPSPIENVFNYQYCATSRALLAAEIIQSIAVYKMEKVSGNFTKAIDIISGVTQRNIDDAIALAEEQNLNKGLYRYSMPVMLPGIDPTASLSHIHIDLASLPDNFDEDTSFKWYVAQLAAAFGVDYQEIAPLMTGNLGSSQQSEIMHLKTRGKGPALIMTLFENIINGGLIPANVEFKFLEQDIRSEREKAETMFTRVKARNLQIKSGELTIDGAREMAILAGDLPRHLAESMGEPDGLETANSEFGPTQVGSGMETQFQKMTMEDIKAIRKAISKNPYDFMQQYKSSIGQPSCTVILPVFSEYDSGFNEVYTELLMKLANGRTRFVSENDYHITLVHSPLADDFEMKAIDQNMDLFRNSFPIEVVTNKLDYFDTPNGKAIILAVEENAVLSSTQEQIFNKFNAMGIPLSDYSIPANWKPHITLAYTQEDFEPIELDSFLRFMVYAPIFTRTDYRSIYNE